MSCPDCFTGHINSGTPTGRWDTVYGLRTYVAEPPNDATAKGVVVIVPDAFGAPFVNNQILADHYAAAGQYRVYLPDFMKGHSAPVRMIDNFDHLLNGQDSWLWKPYYLLALVRDMAPFTYYNRWAALWPTVTNFLRSLREDPDAQIPVGVAGFCWGGQHAIKLANDTDETKTASGRPLVDSCFTAHPSMINVSRDITGVVRNLSIAIGDVDMVLPLSAVKEAKRVLEGKPDVESEVVVYPGAKHGFAVRANTNVPDSVDVKNAEDAEKQAVAWFQRQFAAARPIQSQ